MPDQATHRRFCLAGKVALITAGAGGFGSAISRGFAEHGADVAVTDINAEGAAAVAESVRSIGRKSFSTICDTTSDEQVEEAVKLTVEKLGRLDLLVNIAGVAILKPTLDMATAEFQQTLNSCLTGVFRTSKAAGAVMAEQGDGGSIIHMSSIASAIALGRGTGAYAAAKAGLNAMVRELAVEWAPHNIRTNAIAPCQFRTIAFEKVLDDPRFGGREALSKKMLSRIPIGRFGKPEDIVGPAIFLACDASAMVTGHVLFVDGGYTAG